MSEPDDVPKLAQLSFVEDLSSLPAYLHPKHERGHPRNWRSSCAFCGVGDGAVIEGHAASLERPVIPTGAKAQLHTYINDEKLCLALEFHSQQDFLLLSPSSLIEDGEVLSGQIEWNGSFHSIAAIASVSDTGDVKGHVVSGGGQILKAKFKKKEPTPGCVKLKSSFGQQRSVFPVHLAPSEKIDTGRRRISYEAAIERLADLLLAHRPPNGRTLIYACGQIDYFTIFAFQEVFRLLGVRNLAGNAEHCLNSGAVHNEMLTGQEGPFLTIEQALKGPSRFYLLNGWNGLISHPPVFSSLLKRTELDAFLIEVAVTETASMLASRIGPERVLLIRPGSDSLLALSVGHQLLKEHGEALDQSFLARWACDESLHKYRTLAESEQYSPEKIAPLIAAEARYQERLLVGIKTIAARLADPETVPINLPSVGLSQTRGAVAHCLWGNCFALVGKYGLKAPGEPAGGVIRIPGQVNAQSEIQGLSHKFFMGRIPCNKEGADDVSLRMGLPSGTYETALSDDSRAALDYSDPVDRPELFLCFGTQFESNMMNRERWVKKLKDPNVTFVVVDPIPDPFTEKNAELIIPSPPHAAAAKLYQNGEWRLTLSVPHKKASPDTRTDATIVYDVMALISQRLRESLETESDLLKENSDLAPLVRSGYLQSRFEDLSSGGQLFRVEGEVSRSQLWQRVLDYFANGEGRLGAVYCRPEHESGDAITWEDLVEQGSIVYGGVGTIRYLLNSDDPEHSPFADKFRKARKFQFFTPTAQDIELPTGILLNSGRSTLSDNMQRIRFAISTFNSGKATPILGLPEDNPVYVSTALGEKLGLKTGGHARVRNPELNTSLIFRVVVSERVKGDSVYINFHKTKAEMTEGQYLNKLTSHKGRCPYTAQSNFKLTVVELEAVEKKGEE